MNASRSHILLVDDNEDNRYMLRRRLIREGYQNVIEAENGQEALEKLSDNKADLILLDIMMPVLNGYETLEHLKRDTSLRHIPVIMISAVDELESVIRCIEIGAEDYLSKPFNPALLRARINACLEKKRLRDKEAEYLGLIENERRRADDLLHATLPASVVHELKTTNQVKPRRFEGVTVLFTDIVDFTAYCDSHKAEDVVASLQELVNSFEEIAATHGLEKIKTIGDAVLLTSGLLQHIPDPAVAAARCGLELCEKSRRLTAGWNIRVGIHSGPVVAGVIGKQQHLFDIWGDTVNTASRIVGKAEPGKVLVSDLVWQQIGIKGQGITKGVIEIKGKGGMELIECHGVST